MCLCFFLGNSICFGSVDWKITIFCWTVSQLDQFLIQLFSRTSTFDSAMEREMRDLRGQLEAQRTQGLFRSATSALLPNAKSHVLVRQFLLITVI